MRFILKKIIRKLYHLISFLTLMIIFIPNVKANEAVIDVTNDGQIGQWQLPLATQCFNSSYDSVSTSFEPNYIEVDGAYGKDYYSCSLGSSGLVSITTNQLLSDQVLYSLVLYVGNSSSNQPNYPSIVGVGDSTYTARNDIYYETEKATLWSSRVSNRLDMQQPGNASLVTLHYYAVYVIFTTKTNGTSIAINISYPQTQSSNTWIFGYELNFIGRTDGLKKSDVESALNNSGFATASSVQQVQQSVTQVQQEVSSVNDSITSEDEPTIDLSDIDTASTTPISDLITLPANLLNSYLSAFSGTCSSYTLPLPFNHSVTLPCFTISDYVGSSVANIIDMAICLFMAYEIVLLFIRIFDDITTLSDTYTNWVKRGRY